MPPATDTNEVVNTASVRDGSDYTDAPFDNPDGQTPNDTKGKHSGKFQARRTATQGLYDVALLMANVSQLKSVLDAETYKYQTELKCLLGTSIALHLFSALLLYCLLVCEKYRERGWQHLREDSKASGDVLSICNNCSKTTTCARCLRIYVIDCVATICVFFVTVLNVFIVAFGSNLYNGTTDKS